MSGKTSPHEKSESTDVPSDATDRFPFGAADIKRFAKDPQKFTYAPFDIETTGRLWQDEVNLIGIRKDGITDIFVRTDAPSDDIRLNGNELKAESGENVRLHRCDDEKDLLESVTDHVIRNFGPDTVFVAYNGETFRGGFDMGFLRTRSEQYDMSHPFKGVRFLDPYDAIGGKDRFNTTIPSMSGNPDTGTLSKDQVRMAAKFMGIPLPENEEVELPEGVEPLAERQEWPDDMEFPGHLNTKSGLKDVIRKHESPEAVMEFADAMLDNPMDDSVSSVGLPMRPDNRLDVVHEVIGCDEKAYDPWEDSGKVLDAWAEGNLQDIALHNIADLAQTQEVMNAALRQIAPKELKPKWL